MAKPASRTELLSTVQALGLTRSDVSDYTTSKSLMGFLAEWISKALADKGVRTGVSIRYSSNAPRWANQTLEVTSDTVMWSREMPMIELNRQSYSVLLVLKYASVVSD